MLQSHGGGRRRVPEEAVFALGHGGLLLPTNILPHGEEAYGWQRGQKYHSASGRAMDGRRHTAHTTDTYERLVKWQRFEFSSNREQPPRCFERLRHCDEIDFES